MGPETVAKKGPPSDPCRYYAVSDERVDGILAQVGMMVEESRIVKTTFNSRLASGGA